MKMWVSKRLLKCKALECETENMSWYWKLSTNIQKLYFSSIIESLLVQSVAIWAKKKYYPVLQTFYCFVENRFFSYTIYPDGSLPSLPPCHQSLHHLHSSYFSITSTLPQIHSPFTQKKAAFQELTAKTRYKKTGKNPSYECGTRKQPNRRKTVSRTSKRVRSTSAHIVMGHTKTPS